MKKILPCSDKTREFVSSLLLLAVCLIFGPAGAQAANVTWSGTTNSTWSTGTNWTGGTPVAADTAKFTAGTPANQPTVTASTAVTGLTLTVNPIITINSGQTLTVSGAAGTTGAAGITLKGAGLLSFNATGTNLAFGSGTITLDGGGFGLTGTEIPINTTTGLPTGGGGTDRSLTNNIEVTANGGRLAMNSGSGGTGSAIAFNTLSLGGALTMSSGGGGGADGYTLAGTVTLLQDVGRTLRLTNNPEHNGSDWLAGQITDSAGAAGNALRIAVTGRTLQLSNSTNNYAGGTVIVNSGANTYSYLDVTSAATLGTGNLTMESGGRIRLNNATATGVAGNLASAATISAVAGSAVGVNGTVNIADRFTASSAGVYGIEGARSYSLDMSTLGNGRMFLGTVTGGSYNGTLTAAADSTYRLGGGSAVASLTAATTANILTLTGTNMLTGSNKLIVGSGLNTNASAGRVTMAASQDFVGGITVNSGGLLATSIAGGTPFGNTANTIEVFGQLAATGVNGSFNIAVLPNITFRPGSYLVFNNDLFNNTTGGNNNDRWSDSQAIALNGSRINLQGARSSDTSEAVGAVTFSGNSRLQLTRASSNGQDIQLTPVSLTRSGASTLAIIADGAGSMAKLGGDTANDSFRVVLSGGAPTLLNGSTMVAPSIIVYEGDSNGNALAGAFLTYNSANGTNVPGTRGFTAATFSSTNLNTAGSTDIVNAAATALSSNRTVYALKVTGAITASGSNKTVTIGSGTDSAGLIDQANGGTHTAIFDFGAREAIIWKLLGNTSTYNGIKTSGGLIKSGTTAITLAGASTGNMSISGGVTVNQGQINITTATSATDMADNLLTVNHEGTFNIQDNNVTVAGLSGVGSGGNVVNSGSSAKTLTLDFNSSSQTYEGRLQGTGTAANLSLVKNGNGTQTFATSSVASYTGTTSVNAGTLQVDGNFSAATGAVSVASGATLAGSGTIGGATTFSTGAILAPGSGSGPGILAFGSSLAFNAGSDIRMEINGSTRGTTFDAINVTGALTYHGNLQLTFGQTFGTGNHTFNLWSFGSQSGSFDSITLAGSYSGSLANDNGTWTLTNGLDSFEFSQSTGSLTLNVAVPEPGTWALLGIAASFLLWRRRPLP